LRSAWLLLATVVPARGAYFYVVEGTEKCFVEHLLRHQVLRMTYTMHGEKEAAPAPDARPDPSCGIVWRDPHGKAVKERALVNGSDAGALAHAAQEDGAHRVCLACEPQEWFGRRRLRWSVGFEVLGEGFHGKVMDAAKMGSLASLSAFKGTQAGVELLIERTSAISSDNDYERSFEASFTRMSQAVNTDIAAFKIVEIILITAVTAYQIHHIGKFLQKSHLDSCGGCLPTWIRPVV